MTLRQDCCGDYALTAQEESVMTQPNKKGHTLKTARAIARRKLKERVKRQNAAKYTTRTGKAPSA
jgi:hypothetical protein